jgi:hypothetical protein
VCLCFAPVFWIAGEDMGIIFPVSAHLPRVWIRLERARTGAVGPV